MQYDAAEYVDLLGVEWVKLCFRYSICDAGVMLARREGFQIICEYTYTGQPYDRTTQSIAIAC